MYHEHEKQQIEVPDPYHPHFDSDATLNAVTTPPVKKNKKWLILACLCILFLILLGLGAWYVIQSLNKPDQPNSTATTKPVVKAESNVKQYGNKYANGLLPVGDGKYKTDSPAKGYIYTCRAITTEQGGAGTRGSWFGDDNTHWDMNKKPTVSGNVSWEQKLSITVGDGMRVITTNSLPAHHTGIFPISASDLVHAYDANPNTISAQSLAYTSDANPIE